MSNDKPAPSIEAAATEKRHIVAVADPASAHVIRGGELSADIDAVRAECEAEMAEMQRNGPHIVPNPDMRHTADMGEISGFGGGYETACQNMLQVGLQFINDRRVAGTDLKAHTYKGVYGLFVADNDITQGLEDHIVASTPGCTGAMVQAVMSRLLYIAGHSWEEYCLRCREAHRDESDSIREASNGG